MSVSIIQIRDILESLYNKIWDDWYPCDGVINKATLEIINGECTSGYHKSKDTIFIYVPEGNFFDFEYILKGEKNYLSKLGWYINQTELVHEMLHEFQYKVIESPSIEGRRLFEKKGKTFDGIGHDEYFFSAIVEKSSYFNLSPDDFLKEL